MKVLLIGSGGREHAFAWKMAKSPMLEKLWIAPGNAGTALCGENIDLKVNDFKSIASFISEKGINLVVVGPEDPLVNGLHDFLEKQDLPSLKGVIGPKAEGARLEGSKDFAKAFMIRHGIPTARYKSFGPERYDEGLKFLESLKAPYVLKADGLAAGKGVLICEDVKEARSALKEMLIGKAFGKASEKVVIEEYLSGIELSVFVITDGTSYKILPQAKDYKRIGDGDSGLNTGGMGAVSPVPFANSVFMSKVEEQVVIPTIEGLKKDGIPYQGFIFLGLMNVNGNPYVIEYNVRMGDPETQVVLPRLDADILEVFDAVVSGRLGSIKIKEISQTGVSVVIVAGGYPGDCHKGDIIYQGKASSFGEIFFAGAIEKEGQIVTNGGRVIAFTALADSLNEAIERAYSGVGHIKFEQKYCRRDIGKDLLMYKKQG